MLRITAITSLIVALTTTLLFTHVTEATAGINKTINFQGRLLDTTGATVPDGYYNIQFKIYQDGDGLTAADATGSPAGSLKWTESYINNGSPTGAVQVKNGFLSVNLGSINPFGASVDWNQDTLFLSMNIAGTATACTTFGTAPCAADGEMLPMKRMTATPYSLNSGALNGLTASNFVQLAQGVQTDASAVSSVFINKTAGGNLVQLQNTATDVFTIGNAGDLTFGSNANHTLSVGTSAASTAGKSLTVSGGIGGSGTGSIGGDLVLQGGAAGGTNANGGNLTLDAGAKTGSGTNGILNLGTTTASAVNVGTASTATLALGNASFNSGTQIINIGTNATAGGTTTTKVGSTTVGSVTTIQGGGGVTLTGAVSGSSTINATSGFKFNGTSGATTTCASGEYMQQQIVQGGIVTSGTCTTVATSDLQGTYNNSSTTPIINLSSTGKGIFFRDNATTVGGNLFAVQNSTGATNYLAVTTSGASVAGNFSTSGTLTYADSGAAASTAVCKDGAGLLSTCTAGVAISAFIQGGNDFGADATLGTTGAGQQLIFKTAGTNRLILDSTGANLIFQQASTIKTSGATALSVDSGGAAAVNIGTTNANAVNIGNNTATSGTTSIQSKANTTISTNGVARATFDASGNLFVGNGTSNASPVALTIQGTASTTTAVAGAALNVQGGAANTGNANGGDLVLNGGAKVGSGTDGSVKIGTANAGTVQIGNTTAAVTQTINIGNNTTASSVSNVTIGSTIGASTTTVQGGSGGIVLTGAVSGSSTINSVTGFKFNGTAGATTTCSSGQYMQQQVVQGGITTGGTCTAVIASTTLQQAYDNSAATPLIVLSSTGHGLLIDDAASTVGGNLFAVQNNAQSTNYFAVTTSGASVAGTFSATGTVNNATISGGALSGGSLSSTALTFGTTASTVGLTQAAASTAGGSLTLQGGQSGTGAVNGGDVVVQGGTSAGSGVQGLVKLSTTAFTTATNQAFGGNGGVTQANIDNNSAIQISSTVAGPITVTVPAPTNSTVGRVLYVTVTGANPIILSPSGGTLVTLTPNTTAQLIWNVAGTAWTNAGVDSGSGNYIQNQTGATQTAGFKINGVGTAASFVGSGLDVAGALTVGSANATSVAIGNSTNTTTLSFGGTNASAIGIGNTQTGGTIGIGAALTSGSVGIGGTAGGTSTVTIQGGTSSTAVGIQSGVGGTISVGSNNIANTIQIGSTTLSSGTQAINIGNNNTAGGTTNVTIGTGSTAAGGTTAIQSKANTTVATNGTTRATFDTSGNLYVGDGITSAGTGTFNIQGSTGAASNAGYAVTLQGGTGGSGTGFTGGALTLQGGAGGGTNGNGGNTTVAGGAKTGTGTAGSVNIATNGINRAVFDTTGKEYVGDGVTSTSTGTFTIQGSTGAAANVGYALTLQGGTGGSGTGSVGGALTLQGGNAGGTNANGGNLNLDAGVKTGSGTNGSVIIGENNASLVQLGSDNFSGNQYVAIGINGNATGTTNLEIGSRSGAQNGWTQLQARDSINLQVNGVIKATLVSTSNTLYVGNANTSGQAATANAFTIQGTSSTGASVQGGSLTLQSGAATSGNANGGNLNLTAGAGVGTGATGLIVLNTPTFQTASSQNCGTNCNITQANIDGNGAVIVNATAGSLNVTLSDPTITTAGRVVYVTAANGSNDFTLVVNGGGTGNQIAMRQNTTATMIWNGADWTAAGASSSTTMQAAYDNTLQSAGGAELVVSKTAATNGLTIRDSLTNSVNGTLLSVQTNSAASLFAVNGNVTEYASDAGAEVYGGTTTTFPANTWSAAPVSATITRDITTAEIATGQGSASVVTTTTALSGVENQLSSALTANQHYNVSFTTKLSSGTFTDMEVYYSNQGTNSSVLCTSGQAVKTSVWTKVNCAFTASASGITSSNAIIIRQTGGGTAHTFFVDNLSVTIAADYNYTTDGGADNTGSFSTNWNAATAGGAGGTVTQDLSDGQAASSSAKITGNPATANSGIRNLLSINPLASTLYRVTVYAKATASFTDFKVRYSATGVQTSGSTNYIDCTDYNTQTVATTLWTKITCYITTDATSPTTPYLYFVQTAATAHQFSVDSSSMTLASNATPNVQIGGGINGGPTTLFTLDKGASAPIASDNDSLFGSMYYDTTQGKIQCYQASGWGACGASPDSIITISPEYTNAVMHGTGVGTMTSDLCSGALAINDGTSGQPSICASGETYNFYRWTSPQATAQDYSIYVTYQLPSTFKLFTSGSTSLQARVDNTSNASVKMQIYKNHSGLTACGSNVTITTSPSTWQYPAASGTADPSTCSFTGGDSIVFKITTSSKSNANAYIGNLNFTFSNS